MRIYNDNPQGKRVDDCTVRAIAVATGESWEYTYIMLCIQGFMMADMPHSNAVWAAYLRSRGWKRSVIPNSCPDCYTVRDFALDNPHGNYILGTGTHAVAVVDGFIIDSWISADEVPQYYFSKGN